MRCDDDLVVPANCTITASATLRDFVDGEWVTSNIFGSQLIVEMEDRTKLRLPEGLWIARGLVIAGETGDVQVAILNPTNDIITLSRGTKLATAHKLEDFALCTSTLSANNLQIDEDGWLCLGGEIGRAHV